MVQGILVNSVWVDELAMVKEEFRLFYRSVFFKQLGRRSVTNPNLFRFLSDSQL